MYFKNSVHRISDYIAGQEVCSLLPPDAEDGRALKGTAALILVDRALDALTPSKHHNHVVDRIFSVLPRSHIDTPMDSGHTEKMR